MKKTKYLFIFGLLMILSAPASAYEQFTAKVSSVNVDNGSYYDGTAYCEVSFTNILEYHADPAPDDDGIPYARYAIPIADEPNFSYMYAALFYASQKDKYVTIFSDGTWNRNYEGGVCRIATPGLAKWVSTHSDVVKE